MVAGANQIVNGVVTDSAVLSPLWIGGGLAAESVASAGNVRTVINGLEYSGHALDQMAARGFVPSIVENTIEQGIVFPTRAGTIGYYDAVNNVRVITDAASGRVVTVIPGKP
jgi:hypothetical protein